MFEKIKALFRKNQLVEETIESIETQGKVLRNLTRNAGIQLDPDKEEEAFLNRETSLRAEKYYNYQIELSREQLRLMKYQKRYTNVIIIATSIMAIAAIITLFGTFYSGCSKTPKDNAHRVEHREWRHHWR